MHPIKALLLLRGCVVVKMVVSRQMLLRIATAHVHMAPCLCVPVSQYTGSIYFSDLGLPRMYDLAPEGLDAIPGWVWRALETEHFSMGALKEFLEA